MEKITIAQLVEKLNSLKILQTSIDWVEDIPEDLYNQYFKDLTGIASGINVDKHRWYELALEVVVLPDIGFIGVTAIQDLSSENSSCEDIYHHLKFHEVQEYTTSTWKIKE